MSKCPSCGHDNPAGIELCKGCGARIPDQQSPPSRNQPDFGRASGQPPAEPDGLEARVLAELEAGRKISAVKLYREHTNVGLKQAKDAVEELAAKHGLVAKGGGCAGILFLALVTVAALIATVL